jgi:hypothetical protein
MSGSIHSRWQRVHGLAVARAGGSGCPRRRRSHRPGARAAPIPRPRRWSGCTGPRSPRGSPRASPPPILPNPTGPSLGPNCRRTSGRSWHGRGAPRGAQAAALPAARHRPATPRAVRASGARAGYGAPPGPGRPAGAIPSLPKAIGGSAFSSRSWRAESCPGSQSLPLGHGRSKVAVTLPI